MSKMVTMSGVDMRAGQIVDGNMIQSNEESGN